MGEVIDFQMQRLIKRLSDMLMEMKRQEDEKAKEKSKPTLTLVD